MFYAVNFDVVGTAVFTVEAGDECEARERLEDAMVADGDFARRAWGRLHGSLQADGVACVERMAQEPATCDLPGSAENRLPGAVDLGELAEVGLDNQRCPFCGSVHITGESYEAWRAGEVEQPVTCDECAAAWTDRYRIVRREIARAGEGGGR